MRTIRDTTYYQFVNEVLGALHLDINTFFDDVARNKFYEVQICRWLNEYYQQDKSSKETIQAIHHKRWKILATIDIALKP